MYCLDRIAVGPYAFRMSRLCRAVAGLAALALAVSLVVSSVYAAPANRTGQVEGIVTLLAHSPLDCDHGDDRGDRSTDRMATYKAICAPMHMALPPEAADSPDVQRPAIAQPVAVAFLDGLTSTPDLPPPRLPAID